MSDTYPQQFSAPGGIPPAPPLGYDPSVPPQANPQPAPPPGYAPQYPPGYGPQPYPGYGPPQPTYAAAPYAQAYPPYPPVPYMPAYAQPDASSFGFAALGFFVPLVGLILWLVWRDQTPLKAKSAGTGALIGVCALVGFYVLAFAASLVASIG
ncbi:MAG: hypothetical protein FWC46_00155 [Actinomycetia bacterium]|nr:hypothetical protein [Actinomycetes bacterium]